MSENKDRYEILIEAIEAERQSEETYYNDLNKSQKLIDRQKAGFVWYPVVIVKSRYTVGEYIELEIQKTKNPEEGHKFKVGAAVAVFDLMDESVKWKAVISSIRKDKMNLLIRSEVNLDEIIHHHGTIGVELIYDERPYKIMKECIIKLIKSGNDHHKSLREAIRLKTSPALPDLILHDNNNNWQKGLNPSQEKAVKISLAAPLIGIIHGPPGTGKTTTVVALVQALIPEEKRVLVCAPSNNAADLLAERISHKGLQVLRLGNITRIDDDLMHLTLEEKVRNHQDWQHIRKVKIQSQDFLKRAGQYKRNFTPEARVERQNLKKEARALMQWARELEDRLVDGILDNTQVIVTTLIGVSHKITENLLFKTVIIDEASQAMEPECWNAILKAKRVILAGDHLQLPPTVKSQKAITLGLEETILDRMADVIKHTSLLTEQYRMNDTILGFPNLMFYDQKLISAPSVAKHMIRNDQKPFVFIDTAGCGFDEVNSQSFRSLTNEGEYFIIREHLLANMENIIGSNIGIISPYADQVRYIRQQINDDPDLKLLEVDVNTIDGFQGQEKEIIYISLVRSNSNNEIGFLKDQRRLNVAITRAMKKLVIVGDSATLAQNPLYSDLIAYSESFGHYDSAWNYMQF
ncbi:MAG: AAA family ATPase [Saprospiraceae bacterium]|nr:AAA family ATPase [Saprospiraceae bacterium]